MLPVRCTPRTLEAHALRPRGTSLYYTLMWDDALQLNDAARQKQVEDYRALFEKMLRNMKKLAEGDSVTSEDKRAPVSF